MKRFLLLLTLLFGLSLPAHAQDDDGGTRLERLIEDAISSDGMDVQIRGFRGALSAQATLDRLTISDGNGIWLTLEDAELDWSRAALLSGRVEVNKLSAARLELTRLPGAQTDTPAPEASGTSFSLPDLPVSIDIGEFAIARVELGAAVIGEAVALGVAGAAHLAGGAGTAELSVQRVDGPNDALTFTGSYGNETRRLTLDLALDEAAGGLISTKAGLPGTPSLRLTLKGDAPVDDFTADLTLATDGQDRLAGQITLQGAAEEGHRFAADLAGDLRPLLPPDQRAFLGPRQSLRTTGMLEAGGALALDALDLQTAAVSLSGAARIGADGWPERLALDGRIAAQDGGPVRIAFTQDVTRLDEATLSLAYAAAQGDGFTLEMLAQGIDRPEMALREARISGRGTITRNSGTTLPGRVQGGLTLDVAGLSLADPALAQAAGEALRGTLQFDWQEDAPLTLSQIDLSGAGIDIAGAVTFSGLTPGEDPAIAPDLTVQTRDLARFSGLAGRPLDGAADLALRGRAEPLSGRFDLALSGSATDLSADIAQLDGLLAGRLSLAAAMQRSEAGTFLRRLNLDGPGIGLTAHAELRTGASTGSFALTLPQLSRIQPGLGGAATLQGDLQESASDYALDFTATGPGGTEASGTLTASKTADGGIGTLSFAGKAAATALSAYAPLAGRPLRGGASFDGAASYTLADGALSARGDLRTSDLALGIPTADSLLGGTGTATVSMTRDGSGKITVERLDLSTTELTATLSGSMGQTGDSAMRYDIALRDLGRIVEQLPGRATATGTLSATGTGPWQVNTSLTAPGGTEAQVSGSLARAFDSANLAISGAAPLALVNRFAEPNLLSGLARMDLRLDGPLAPASLSGTIRVSGAEAVLPGPALTLTGIDIDTTLGGGQARLTVEGDLSTGGRLQTQGTVGLNAPYAADLRVRLRDLVLQDRRLYQARAEGNITVQGPLLTGPRVAGWVEIAEAELRIPETGLGPGSRSFTLTHIAEPAAVHQTRARAGLLDAAQKAGGRPYTLPLDLEIRAPSRLFVRGRGLDAELGGTLRLTGTSQNVVPVGRFDLIRGRLDILGQRLTLEKAILRLTGDFDPTLEVEATSERDGTVIKVALDGQATSPEVSFSSDPARPEEEVLALLLFGRDVTELSALQALRIAAAVNTLAGKGGEGIVGNLRRGFGLDDFDVTTDDQGNAGLRLGKYISDNIYTDVEINSGGDTAVNLNIQINRNVKARGQVSTDGNTGFGVFFEKDY
ncbi:translocation/assembly module TamB domain-containing protein [Salipiger sp. P9]|uniref:translocation/assembly module TamB domain-containing protein n=1 Tax=Salipiger pentaromativorans TaxID=2943193 RepID=UPI002157D984|nr:translocation/assembly module TamB domain-containing protein [Salipiger pentaromativorans]MCR8546756.1 translocation/assembly module TamB domain-containing protein [Salipiger pentaromativorans]